MVACKQRFLNGRGICIDYYEVLKLAQKWKREMIVLHIVVVDLMTESKRDMCVVIKHIDQ